MKAVILAGGFGSRMRPLTDDRPKPLLPLAGTVILARITRRLAEQGVRQAVLATGHLAEAFTPAVLHELDLGLDVVLAVEAEPLGTGGALLNALDVLGQEEAVAVVNGDSLTDHDLAAQVERHGRSGGAVTVHVRHVDDARPFGLVEVDDEGRVLQFREKPRELRGGLVNAGTYVVEPTALEDRPRGVVLSLEREVFPALATRSALHAYREDCYVADLGTPSSYLAASRRIVEQSVAAGLPLAGARADGSWVHPTADVHPDAVLEASVVLEGARIPSAVLLRGCIVGEGAVLGAGAQLDGIVLGPGLTLPGGLRPSPGTAVDATVLRELTAASAGG